MKDVKSFASGRELVLWCANCHSVIARLGGMHDVDYLTQLANDHTCKEKL